jgi:Family of unknown function (DUF6178)
MTDELNHTNEATGTAAVVREVSRRMRQRPNAVFDVENPELVVPLLPVQELLFAVQEMGVTDAVDLVALTTPVQVRAFLDLSVWTRDRLEPDEADDWLVMLLELEDDDFLEKMRGLDPELLGTLLRKYAEVIDPQLQPVSELDMAPYVTPDTFFYVWPRTPEPDPDTGEADPEWDLQGDPRYLLVTRLLDKLYRMDSELGRVLVMETASSTTSEMEELAYRWRTGRLADLGYEPYAQALEILQFLDPAQLVNRLAEPDPSAPLRDPEDPVTLGGVVLEPYTAGNAEPFLSACLETLSPEELDRITLGFTFLANRIAAATLTQPGDVDQMGEVLTRSRRGLNLGLEYLTRRKLDSVSEVFTKVPVSMVFRVGHSLTLQLQRLVGALGRSGRLSLATRGHTLLEGSWRDLAEGLSERFPQVTRGFDAEPREGFRPILGLADLLHATQLVEDLGAQWPLCFLGLKFELDWLTPSGLEGCIPSEPGAVRLGDLFRTAALNRLQGRGLRVVPLKTAELKAAAPAVAKNAADLEAWTEELALEATRVLEESTLTPPERLRRILRTWLAPLATEPLDGLVLQRTS